MKLEEFISELMPALDLATELRARLKVEDAFNGVEHSQQSADAIGAIRRACKAITKARDEGVQS